MLHFSDLQVQKYGKNRRVMLCQTSNQTLLKRLFIIILLDSLQDDTLMVSAEHQVLMPFEF